MQGNDYVRPGRLRTAEEFLEQWQQHGDDLGVAEVVRGGDGPLGSGAELFGKNLTNRFASHPMEGWDGSRDGRPTELTLRRWRRFGESGAALLWGCEAFSVEPEGRANPNQLCWGPEAAGSLERLRGALQEGSQSAGATLDERAVGLQLTHSGRWSRPEGDAAPLVPASTELDERVGEVQVLTDGELERIGEGFVASARCAWQAGFDFVDVKCCHGYLLNELLGGRRSEGTYRGRTGAQLFVERVIEAIQGECPGLGLGVRISLGDSPPFAPGDRGVGVQSRLGEAQQGLGFDMIDADSDAWADPALSFLRYVQELGVQAVNISLGCPYTTPHLLRPAAYPPSDGYLPPEDPLAGVARHLRAARLAREECPGLRVVGSGYSYLQEWLSAVAEYEIEQERVDFVGLGRMMLSYPEFPRDELEARPLRRKLVCRTFSDCTTAPRHQMVSGCYPLDPFYKERPEAARVRELRQRGVA
ncbi:MAG: NADH:flavin oxidoreductase [Acidobacteriota bacterium]